MKLFTKRIIATIAFFAVTACAAYVVKAIKPDAHYPKTFVVSACDSDNDMVFLVDFNGNEWTITGIEDWAEGDIASAIMSDNGTPEIYDDTILDIRYSGYLW